MTTSTKIVPTVGMPATFCIGSDRYGGEIKEVRRNGRTVVFGRPGRNGDQVFTLRKDGSYIEQGCDCGRLSIGAARDHWDPHR